MAKFVEAKTKAEAKQSAGFDWSKIVKVSGGYMMFETMDEYKTWKNQR